MLDLIRVVQWQMTLADLALYGNYLEYDEIYGDQNPINATSFPSLYKLVKAMEAGKAGDYAKHRRDSGCVPTQYFIPPLAC